MDRSVLLIFQQAVSDIQIASSLLLSQHQPVKPPTTCLFERFSLLLPVRSSDKLKNSQEESPKKLATCINICCFCFKKKTSSTTYKWHQTPKTTSCTFVFGKNPFPRLTSYNFSIKFDSPSPQHSHESHQSWVPEDGKTLHWKPSCF